MKYFLLFAIFGVVSVFAQSNDTVTDQMMSASNETLSGESPDANISESEPAESKQTVSLQSAEKSAIKDDDNSNLVSNAADTVSNAAKDAKQAVSNAAESAGETVSNAAQTVGNQASEAASAVGNELSNATGNGAGGIHLVSSFGILALVFSSIRFF
ncbi:hypothetical protein FO519_001981 [Halicephalobus sp. NKZ332]|nr:hypothetical protein FO519_001981 [Halicephalobus sp. NKZ332]